MTTGAYAGEWLEAIVNDAFPVVPHAGALRCDVLNAHGQGGRELFFMPLKEEVGGCLIVPRATQLLAAARWTVPGEYVRVLPHVCVLPHGIDTWPRWKHTRRSMQRDSVHMHWWLARACGGVVLSHVQTDFESERALGRSVELVACHLCGNKRCIRPAHLALQTRTADCKDRDFHREEGSGHIRPDCPFLC